MNYKKIYTKLIEKAKSRQTTDIITGEIHHILPRCLGGTDDKDNLVLLTPEEHFVAHLLLVKIHKGNNKLIYAANMMTVGSPKHGRSSNKRYGWLRKQFKEACKGRTGENNNSYGTVWVTHLHTQETKKIKADALEEGWVLGRSIKQKKICYLCQTKVVDTKFGKCCAECRIHMKIISAKKSADDFRKRKESEDFAKFKFAIENASTWSEAIRLAGFATDGYSRVRLQRFAKEHNLCLGNK